MRLNRYTLGTIVISILLASSLWGCREDVVQAFSSQVRVAQPLPHIDHWGFYLLNEGNMGTNASTLDYFDFSTGIYTSNIYAERNPKVPKELGDVGNDLQVYRGVLWAVINVSNKIEIMDATTTKRITTVEIPNCRYVRFHGDYAYVTSYAGPVSLNPDIAQIGVVYKVDVNTYRIVGRTQVGYQPDELAIWDGKIYVANSGGYMSAGRSDRYETEVSVIDLETFKETHRIEVAPNLHHIKADGMGGLWVNSRGDYLERPSRLYYIDARTEEVKDSFNIAVLNYTMDDNLLYVYGKNTWHSHKPATLQLSIIDMVSRKVITEDFITDGTDKQMVNVYGILIDPETKDVYLTDAGSYTGDGIVFCYTPDGKMKWHTRGGNIPAHFALVKKEY